MRRRRALAALLLPAAHMARAQPRTFEVACGESLPRAVAAAADGDTVLLEAGEHRAQAAVVDQRRLTLRAEGGTAVLLAEGAHAEGKALLVVRQGWVRVEGLQFRGVRVPHGNGAGVRFEGGRLELLRCGFFDNEMGLLTANTPDAEVQVVDCEFGQAPRHSGALHHLLYVGRMRRLLLRDSRLWGGWRGHLVKSRAQHNLILCNRIDDGDQGEASYQIDLPNGGQAWVAGNLVVQGAQPQNHTLLAYGAEGRAHADGALHVLDNVFVNRAAEPAAFVRLWPDRLPAGTPVQVQRNRFHGAAVDGSWGRSEDDNLLLPLDEGRQGPQAPPCTAAPTEPG